MINYKQLMIITSLVLSGDELIFLLPEKSNMFGHSKRRIANTNSRIVNTNIKYNTLS